MFANICESERQWSVPYAQCSELKGHLSPGTLIRHSGVGRNDGLGFLAAETSLSSEHCPYAVASLLSQWPQSGSWVLLSRPVDADYSKAIGTHRTEPSAELAKNDY